MRRLMTGNEAVAEGALLAGCNFYSGYPITPSSEIMHIMAAELPKRGGNFIQAEDELAAINIAVGASIAGAIAMTATSGPGFSLMQEGIGYAIMTEVPVVIVNVMRVGPSTGQATKPAQGDLMQARWGRHGDQALVVYAPSSPQEALYITHKAFETAELLRTPVVVLTDEFIAHGREVVEYYDLKPVRRRIQEKPEPPFGSEDPTRVPPLPPLGEGFNVMFTGSTHDEWGYRDVHRQEVHFKLVKRIWDKIWMNSKNLFLYEKQGDDDAEVTFVCYGSVSRSVKGAIAVLRSKGIRAKLLRLITLWPIDWEVLEREIEGRVFVPEMSLGQLSFDVEKFAKVEKINKVGGGIPIYPSDIVKAVVEVMR
ncbi:MAG: 2-oxoacid:acceptor oxidoreductase subunit alpha [Candidatus Methanodesulfokora sp.]